MNVRAAASRGDLAPYTRMAHQRSTWAIASLAIIVFFALSLIVDSRRLLWYDEISTIVFVRLPSLAAIWHAMHMPIDGSTPTYFFLEKIFYNAFHETPLAARVLSSIAVAAGLVVVFDCVTRLAGGLYGLLAMGVLMSSFLPYYSYEARAYGLEFLFSAAALWVWLFVESGTWRQPLLFGACFLLGELGHYYFVFCVVPYCAYELLTWRTGPMRIRTLLAAFAGCIAALAMLFPAVLVTRELSKHFWAAVTLSVSLNTFDRFFPHAMGPLCGCALWLALVSLFRKTSEDARRIAKMTSAEQLGWLFLLIPVAGIIGGRFVTHAFVERYFITFLPGVAVAVACACSRLFRTAPMPAIGVIAIVLGFGLVQHARSAVHPDIIIEAGVKQNQQLLTAGVIQVEPRILKDKKQFIVVPDAVLFLESRFYSRAPERYPFVPELTLSIKDFTNALTLTNMSSIAGFPLWTIADIERNAPDTALVDPPEGLLRRLRRDGFTLTVRVVNPIYVDYLHKN